MPPECNWLKTLRWASARLLTAEFRRIIFRPSPTAAMKYLCRGFYGRADGYFLHQSRLCRPLLGFRLLHRESSNWVFGRTYCPRQAESRQQEASPQLVQIVLLRQESLTSTRNLTLSVELSLLPVMTPLSAKVYTSVKRHQKSYGIWYSLISPHALAMVSSCA